MSPFMYNVKQKIVLTGCRHDKSMKCEQKWYIRNSTYELPLWLESKGHGQELLLFWNIYLKIILKGKLIKL